MDPVQNSEKQNPELDKISNGQNPELDKIPIWTKSRIGQNPESNQHQR